MVVLVALVPVLAWAAAETAATPTGWSGVYTGRGSAKALGSDYSRAVTIFAKQKGGQVEMLIQVAGTSVTAAGTPQMVDENTMKVPFSLNDGGIEGSGVATFVRSGSAWTVSATGEGSAYGFAGDGTLSAKRRTTRMPTVTEQVAGTAAAVAGSTDQEHVPPPADGPTTITDPPEPANPVSTNDAALEYLYWVLMLIVLVFG